MTPIPLKQLVQALADSVVHAQNAVESQQIALLSQFFDDQGRPQCMRIMVPKMGSSDRDQDYNVLQVPLISIVEATMLHISEFEVSFSVELSGFDPADEDPVGPPTSPDPEGEGESAQTAPPAGSADPAPVAGYDTIVNRDRVRAQRAPIAPLGIGPADTPPSAAGGPAAAHAPVPAAQAGSPSPAMTVGLGPRDSRIPTAQATLKVSSRSMSDGMVRLLNHLNKGF